MKKELEENFKHPKILKEAYEHFLKIEKIKRISKIYLGGDNIAFIPKKNGDLIQINKIAEIIKNSMKEYPLLFSLVNNSGILLILDNSKMRKYKIEKTLNG